MTQNIEQRTEVAVTKYEGAATSVDEIAHTDKTVETPVGPRKSFPKISREWENDSALIREDWRTERDELSTKALGVKAWESGQTESNINQQRRWTDDHTYLPKSVPVLMDASGPDDNWIPYTADNSSTLKDVFGRKPLALVDGVVLIPNQNNQYPKLQAFGDLWEIDDDNQQYTVSSFTKTPDGFLVITLNDNSQRVGTIVDGASRKWVDHHEIENGKGEQKKPLNQRVDFNFDIRDYGGDASNSDSENLIALNKAISAADAFGGGAVYCPGNISYGFHRSDTSTWPSLKQCVNNVSFFDESLGKTYSGEIQRDGNQCREWHHTPGAADGMHDGNFRYMYGDWHSGLCLYHTGGDEMLVENGGMGKNRRLSIMTGVNGQVYWRFGQGGFTDDSMSDEQLSNFLISANGLPDLGLTGLTHILSILKTNGYTGLNTSSPAHPYHFAFRNEWSSGAFVLDDYKPGRMPFIALKGAGKDFRITPQVAGGVKFSDSGSTVLEMKPDGQELAVRRATVGNVSHLLSTQNFNRKSMLRDDNGTYNITDSTLTTNTFTHDNAGNLSITGAYSPFTGTHPFFSPVEITAGMAVDIINPTPVLYPVHTELDGEWITNELELPGTVGLSRDESKVCLGVAQRCEPMEGGYIVFVAAVGDNLAGELQGFFISSESEPIEAGDILCTSNKPGWLKKAPQDITREVVTFKCFFIREDGRAYGYF